MSFLLKIKEEFESAIVGYNNSGLPLGQRDDLLKLAEIAQFNPALQNLFEKYPSPEELKSLKEDNFLDKTQPPAQNNNSLAGEDNEEEQ